MKHAFVTGIFDNYNLLPSVHKETFLTFFKAFKEDPLLSDWKYPKGGKHKNIYIVGIDSVHSAVIGYFQRFDLYLLLQIGKDQEMYDYMNHHVFSVESSKNTVYISYQRKESTDLFAHVSNLQLLEIGVPLEILHLIRNIHSIEELEEYENELDTNTYLCLIALSNREYEVNKLVDEYKNENLFKNNKNYLSSTPMTLIYIHENTDFELLASKPEEKWSITLYDEQNRLINKDYIGPARLLGVAGSGKTIIALKRAKRLASTLEENEKILVTTFTKNLLADLDLTLHQICNDEELSHIVVKNTDALFHDLFEELIHDRKIDYTGELFKEVYNSFIDFPFSIYTCKAEWEKVAEANEAYTKEEFVFAPHLTRPDRFSYEEKQKLWELFERYIALMEERKLYDREYAYYYLYHYIQNTYHDYFYKHIIIDEAQDLSQSELKLLRALAGKQHRNDLYIVGDEKQRIYLKKAILEKCEIDIGNRNEYLSTCYRTTNGILQYALGIVKDIENNNQINVSLNIGKTPEIHEYRSFEQEIEFILSKIVYLYNKGVELKEICIVLRSNASLMKYSEYLENKGWDTYILSADDFSYQLYDAIRITTIHRVKGLEYDYIFLAEMNQCVIPGDYDYQSELYQYLANQQKCLLYVALTRARKEAYITSSDEMSVFIDQKKTH